MGFDRNTIIGFVLLGLLLFVYLYINTKSTGSVVAQQPFGGSRGSGTNDKVGSVNFLNRFTSVRAVKEDW